MTNKQATIFPIIGSIIWVLTNLWSLITLLFSGYFDFEYIIGSLLHLATPVCFIIFFVTLYKSLK